MYMIRKQTDVLVRHSTAEITTFPKHFQHSTCIQRVTVGIGVCSPPPVDPNVGRSGEPGVEDVDAADAVRTQQRFLERRVVVEPQALPEPVDRINDHHSTGRVL